MEQNQPETYHTNYIAFIRHGERSDFVNEDMDSESKKDLFIMDTNDMNQDDPPLTKKGMRMALKTGQYLKKYIEDNKLNFTKIIIQTSPLIRTIMTANGIALGLFGDQNNVEIQVDSHLTEFLGMFDHDPMKGLELYKPKNEQERAKLYKQYHISQSVRINTKDDSYANKISSHFPEDRDDGLHRQFITHNFMLNRLKEMKVNGGVLMINVTHCLQTGWASSLNQLYCNTYSEEEKTGESLDETELELFKQLEKEVQQNQKLEPDSIKNIKQLVDKKNRDFADYCAISGALFKSDGQSIKDFELTHMCYDKHIE